MTASATKNPEKVKQLRPLSDRVVIRPNIQDGKTDAGIIIPESALKKRRQGLVVATGPGKWNPKFNACDPMRIYVGDTVFFGEWTGTDVTMRGVELMVCHQDDILAVIEEVERDDAVEGKA